MVKRNSKGKFIKEEQVELSGDKWEKYLWVSFTYLQIDSLSLLHGLFSFNYSMAFNPEIW